jgi:ectoine hydroxylase-related dioxygenase (phytanoyl-CoA dioxygenase family)
MKGLFNSGDKGVAAHVNEAGYAIVDSVVDLDTVADLISALAEVGEGGGVRKRASVYAIRNLLDEVPAVRTLSQSPELRRYVDEILSPSAIPVRGILFDKTPDANWTVPWHQDLSIAVRERVDVDGYGPWSVKAGVPHVQPPASILEQMVTLRLHLDDCGLENGPLEVLSGSHKVGRLTETGIEEWKALVGVRCPVAAGGIVLMRPLILHRSLSASTPGHRRVVHIEYASASLPGGLDWYQSMPN